MDQKRASAFDFFRLAFAFVVLAAHMVVLAELPVPAWVREGLLQAGYYCVQGFFVISGHLVAASLKRSQTVRLYAEKRVRRLYPAYAFIVLACAAIGLVFSAQARADLPAVGRYLAANLVFLNFLEPEIPGLFQGNPFTEVNGALWTVKIEVMFYIVLPVLAWMMTRAERIAPWAYWALAGAIYLGAEVWWIALPAYGETLIGSGFAAQLSRQLPGQMDIFIVGMVLADKRLVTRENALRVGGGAAALLALSAAFPPFKVFEALAVGTLVVAAGRYWRPPVDVGRFGDLSYGVYAMHFPIIQTLIAGGVFAASHVFGTIAATGITFAFAVLMWRYIEKPALRTDSAYRQSAG